MNNQKLKTSDLFDCAVPYLKELFVKSEYPWEMLEKIGLLALQLVNEGIDGFSEYIPGVLIGKDVKIYDSITIEPPAVIGNGCIIRPGAFIRGSVITGDNCVIGNSTELKNCILLVGVQAPHYNYIGDSILGNGAHMGAGAICSNLKADKTPVVVRGSRDYVTGIKKFGAILADHTEIGCGSVLNPGTVIGKNSNVYPLVSVRGFIPENRIVKSANKIALKEERI
ncbi:MAG: UDP-N-acetylglucosamine pyrophosphorylase [Firmicutes bacterium]|nr:UDP-N-acetylglucosamine pyrophosphorylase [Bacillota bacterium]